MSTWRDHRILGLTPGEFVWLIPVALVALVYEVLAALQIIEGDVLTRAYRANTSRWMIWPVGVGVLMGHLNGPAWTGAGTGIAGRSGIVALIALGLGILYRDLVIRGRYPQAWVPWLFAAGVVLGALLWVGRP